ncbi:MAG: 30S ribosomal protein S19 [Candidatus Diapherotrites archaeon CG08_land_8_20_14_0_20_30_16]|nr:MAG: 30S ribosomal protein S19 [Candidatus Diapherotrites archaeon CG08_land_8_20_14_0_20_30_16]
MVKDFMFRGLTWDELLKANQSTLEKAMNARARRSLKRSKFLDKKIKRAIVDNLQGKAPEKPVKTHKRDILITPDMVGLKFAVYDGKAFQTIGITKEMVGFPLGEFVETRKRPKHSKAGIGATRSSKHITKK